MLAGGTCALEVEGEPSRAADGGAHAAFVLAGSAQACAHQRGCLLLRLVDVAIALRVVQHDDTCSCR